MVLLYFFFFQNLLYLKLFMYVVFMIWFRFCFEQSQCYRQGRVQVLQGPPPPPHGRQLQARLCSSERQDLEQGFNQRQHLKNTLTKEISYWEVSQEGGPKPFSGKLTVLLSSNWMVLLFHAKGVQGGGSELRGHVP